MTLPAPTVIRHLASSTSVYRRVLDDAAELIRDAIPLIPPPSELAYAHLLLYMNAANGPLSGIEEQCRLMLGEETS